MGRDIVHLGCMVRALALGLSVSDVAPWQTLIVARGPLGSSSLSQTLGGCFSIGSSLLVRVYDGLQRPSTSTDSLAFDAFKAQSFAFKLCDPTAQEQSFGPLEMASLAKALPCICNSGSASPNLWYPSTSRYASSCRSILVITRAQLPRMTHASSLQEAALKIDLQQEQRWQSARGTSSENLLVLLLVNRQM